MTLVHCKKIKVGIKPQKCVVNVSKCQSRIYVTFLRGLENSLGFFKINYKKCNYVFDPTPSIFEVRVFNLRSILYETKTFYIFVRGKHVLQNKLIVQNMILPNMFSKGDFTNKVFSKYVSHEQKYKKVFHPYKMDLRLKTRVSKIEGVGSRT